MHKVVLGFLLVAGLAGCLEPNAPSEPESSALQWSTDVLTSPAFGILDAVSIWTPASSDGAQMHTKVWLPDTSETPDWKAPIILVDTPYQTPSSQQNPTDETSRPAGADYSWLIDHFVPRGYAVAFKDVRGTGESGGCIEQTGAKQRQDGYDVIEDLATQEWANGHVGMYGRSYRAETQWGAAILQPPHLTTVIPVASVSGQYEWNFYAGVPFTGQSLAGQAVYAATSGAPPPTSPTGLTQYPTHYECQAEMMAAGVDMSGDWNAYWEERELRKHFDQITVPVLYVHGMQDWNVRQVAIRDAWEHIPGEKRLMLGQWGHAFPDNYYSGDSGRDDWKEMVHAWFDHHLMGIENGVMDALPPVQVQDSEGAWRQESDWPPVDAAAGTWYANAEGAWLPDPQEPFALQLRENEEAFVRQYGVPLQDVDTPQETELRFEFTAEERMHIAGWPQLDFELKLFDGLYPDPDTATDAHFAANLYIDGAWVNAGYLSARHRDGVETPSPVPENEWIAYTLLFHPQDTVIPAGATVTVTFAGSDGDAQPEGTFWGAEMRSASLQLPLVTRDLDATGLDVPTS